MKRSTVVDLAGLAVVAFFTIFDARENVPGTREADALTYLLVGVSIVALLFRRRRPIPVAAVCMAALTGWFAMGHYGEVLQLPSFVALYTVAVQGTVRGSVVVGAVAMILSFGQTLIGEATLPDYIVDSRVGYPTLVQIVWPAAALLLGESVRTRRELLAESAARLARAEAEREERAGHLLKEERVRIAREIHDVVAHTVAGINVQAGVAVDAFDSDPEVARRALQQVRGSGREAMHELRATVSLLRDDDVSEAARPPVSHASQSSSREPGRRAWMSR